MATLYSFVYRVDVQVWRLLVVIVTFWPSCECQAVILNAPHTGQTSPFTVYFADGQNTSVIGSDYLPQCVVVSGSGPYIWLEKTDGSLRISEHGQVNGLAGLPWDTTAHPTLNTSYTGTYVCRTSTFNSTAVYHINVVQRIVVTQQPSSLLVNDTVEKYSVISSVRGVFPFNVSWTSSATLATEEPSLTRFSFLSNDSGIPLGVPFTVNLTAKYTANIPCAGSTLGNGYSLAQTVIDNCNAAAMPSQATTTVTVQRTPCPAFHTTNNFINPVASAAFGTIAMISCVTGYGEPMPTSIQCMAGGVWSAQPMCTSVDECMIGKHNCMEYCADTTPGFVCVCYNGTVGCLVSPTTPPAATTAAATSAAATSAAATSAAASAATSDIITVITQAESSNTLVVAIGAAAGGVAVGMLLMLLIGILLKHRKTHQTEGKPAPGDTSAPATQNVAYEDADVEMTETPMTSSDAYGVMDVPPQPNYEYVQP